MVDARYGYAKNSDDGFRHQLSSSKRFSTNEACYADWQVEAARREEVAGRQLSREELVSGIARPDTRTLRERREAERRRAAELAPAVADERTPAEQHLDRLRAEQEEERRAALSPRERRLLRAEQAVATEKAASSEAAAREAASGTDAARRVSNELAAAILHAEFSPDVSQADLDELRHQAALLDRFGDAATVSRNVLVIQTNMLTGLTTQAEALKASADRIAAKAARLKSEPEPPKPAGDVRSLLQP